MSSRIALSTLGYVPTDFKQEQSFYHALSKGISVIDTAFWSADGSGLDVVAQYLKAAAKRSLDVSSVTIIAKGGFATGRSLSRISKSSKEPLSFTSHGIDSIFSLNPTFISTQLAYTTATLAPFKCHTFLLYLPDIFMDGVLNQDRVLDDLRDALSVLEKARQRGDIMQYGLSGSVASLTVSLLSRPNDSLAILKSEFPGFSVIQTPFNCAEMDIMYRSADGRNFLDIVYDLGFKLWVNRPIAARIPKGQIKMREYLLDGVVPDLETLTDLIAELSGVESILNKWLSENLDESTRFRDFNTVSSVELSVLLSEHFNRISGYSHWENWWSSMFSPQVERFIYSLHQVRHSDKMAYVSQYSDLIARLKTTFDLFYKQRSNVTVSRFKEVLSYLFPAEGMPIQELWLRYLIQNNKIDLISVGSVSKEHINSLVRAVKSSKSLPVVPQVSWDNVKSYVEEKRLSERLL